MQLNQQLNEPFEEYIKQRPNTVSASDLKKFRISPKHYKYYTENKEEQEQESKALLLGSAIHTYLLEKDLFESRYACLKRKYLPFPEKDYRTKANKDFRDIEFPIMSHGKKILEESEYTLIENVCEQANKNEHIKELIRVGRAEVSTYSTDKKTQLIKKGRADLVNDKKSTIIDIKTCMNSSPRAFSYDVFKHGYHIQAAHYLDLFGMKNFIFVALEKTPPFTAQIYLLDEGAIEQGRQEVRMYLDILVWCKTKDYYPDYSEFESLKRIYIINNQFYEEDWSKTKKILDIIDEAKKNNDEKKIITLPMNYVENMNFQDDREYVYDKKIKNVSFI